MPDDARGKLQVLLTGFLLKAVEALRKDINKYLEKGQADVRKEKKKISY